MKKNKSLTNELKVIVVNPPSKKETSEKIKNIKELLIKRRIGCKNEKWFKKWWREINECNTQ